MDKRDRIPTQKVLMMQTATSQGGIQVGKRGNNAKTTLIEKESIIEEEISQVEVVITEEKESPNPPC